MIMFCVFCQHSGARSLRIDGERIVAHENCYDIDKLLEHTIVEDDVW